MSTREACLNRRRTGDPHGLTAGSRGRPVAVTAEFLAGKRIAVTGVSRTPKTHGITVIDGGCPLMFGPTADTGHKIMRLVYARKVRAPETEPFLQAAAPGMARYPSNWHS
jgi:hypothetical protein